MLGALAWNLSKDDTLSWCGNKHSAKCCDATNCIWTGFRDIAVAVTPHRVPNTEP